MNIRGSLDKTIFTRSQKSTKAPRFVRIATDAGCAAMPLFRVGDRVEGIGALVPTWMREGIVIKLIPQKHGIGRQPFGIAGLSTEDSQD